MEVYNFSAGPAILPKEVFQKASEAVLNFNNSGLSILEISHRSDDFKEVMNEAQGLVRELLDLSEDYEVLFLQGGASTQFLMTAMNVLGKEQTAGFIDTGSWSAKAIKEAKLFGNVKVLASSKEDNYNFIPKTFDVPEDLVYLHLTSNNTIYGTQFKRFPSVNVPIIADMSSDIFSRPIDASRFGLIYAGAQKNMGPAGTTLVVANKEFVANPVREVPTMLNYNTHINKDSMFNTPPVFAVYVSMLTLRWVKDNGGIEQQEIRNREKSQALYNAIEASDIFYTDVREEDRSDMNVVFKLRDSNLESLFLEACNEAGCKGVKGHRSVGGFRASIYNALKMEGVQVLVGIMQEFERNHG